MVKDTIGAVGSTGELDGQPIFNVQSIKYNVLYPMRVEVRQY